MDKRGLKVGDYLYESWGYDQTNIDFYKVTELVGKSSVKIIPVKGTFVEDTDYKVAPTDEVADYDVLLKFKPKDEEYPRGWKPEDGPIMKRAKDGWVRLSSGYSASLYDGEPKYETPSYMGR